MGTRQELEWLARQYRPVWGGHLQRGEPLPASQMREWVEDGIIEAVGAEGYVLTDKGRALLQGT